MLPPTLFFTLYVYALHEVTFVTSQPFKGREIEAKISLAHTCEADERRTKSDR
jgi:hypothetical protein